MAGVGAGAGYLQALQTARNSAHIPVSAGTRAAIAAAKKQTAAKESEYLKPAGSGIVQVAQAAPQEGKGRRRKHRKATKKHSRRRRTHRRR